MRVSTPRVASTSSMCFFTVLSEMPRMAAISGLVLPWATQSSTSATRGVRPNARSSGAAEEKSGLNSARACWAARANRARIAASRSALATGLVR